MPSIQETTILIESNTPEKYAAIHLKREFHSEETSIYWLPKDDDEQKRLTGQHFSYKELLDGYDDLNLYVTLTNLFCLQRNVLTSVRESLNFEKGVSVLDIGCGSGVWIMDMIQDFPNCTYDGCDIVDVISKKLDVKQFTFREGNVLHGLPYPDNTFDFVHMRLLVYALREEEWPVAIKEAIRVVKPGGMLQLVESGLVLPKDSSSAYCKFVNAVFSVSLSRGQNPRIIEKLENMILANENVKVEQCIPRRCILRANTSVSKKFRWCGVELAKAFIPHIKSILGLKNEDDAQRYIEDLKNCIASADCCFDTTAVSAPKF
ncbi:unnamed protein product [Rhizopus stolonifer]